MGKSSLFTLWLFVPTHCSHFPLSSSLSQHRELLAKLHAACGDPHEFADVFIEMVTRDS